jgi:hypothetical protein
VEQFEGNMGILILNYHASFGTSTMDVELANITIDDLNVFEEEKRSRL